MSQLRVGPGSVGFLVAFSLCTALSASQGFATAPCCTIAAINKATGVVTLRDNKTGKLEKVTVTDRTVLATLAVGQSAGPEVAQQHAVAPSATPRASSAVRPATAQSTAAPASTAGNAGTPTPGTSAGGIAVISASYGLNVDARAATGNVTADIAQACNGQTNCGYRVDFHRIGDPFPGRQKTYTATYNCGDSQQRQAFAPAEAGFGSVVSLHCP